jgi:hypothetical protein
MILTWVSILFLLYIAFLWWEIQKKPPKPLIPSVEIAAPIALPTESDRATPPTRSQPVQQSAGTAPVTRSDYRTVTKCMVNGQVIFTDRDCPTGSKSSSVTVNTANVGTVAPQAVEPATTPRRKQSVVSNISSEGAVGNPSTRNAECGYLDEQIKLIDALARQPQSGQSQDALSSQRKRFRSRQYELHC